MLNQKRIALIIPFYNEEGSLSEVITTIPDFVDIVILVDDGSQDKSVEVVHHAIQSKKGNQAVVFKGDLKQALEENIEFIHQRTQYFIIQHSENLGKGAGVKTGYQIAKKNQIDCVATMDGDGQMNPLELINLCLPIVNNQADYTKGNRLEFTDYKKIIPTVRLFGIKTLAWMTRISSGYHFIQDAQSGYTAISYLQLQKLDIDSIYDKYGYVNDILIRLSVIDSRVKEIPVTPIYKEGRVSKMNVFMTMPKIAWMMFRMYFWKLKSSKG